MINLTVLGVVSLALGLIFFAIAVYRSVKNSQYNDDQFKHYIENICWGALVGTILFFSVICFSVRDHISKSNHQCCEQSVTDSTVVTNQNNSYRYDKQD